MRYLRLFPVLLVLGLYVPAHAQIAFEFYGGPSFGTFKSKSFNTFASSYNTANTSSGLTKEMKPLRFGSGYQFGAAIWLRGEVGLSTDVHHVSARTSAEFADGTKRLIHYYETVPVDFGVVFGKIDHFKFRLHAGLANEGIESGTEYPDGTVSYGKDRALNGVMRAFGFYGGLDFSAKIRLTDFAALELGLSFDGVAGKNELFNDWNWGKSLDLSMPPTGLPLDVNAFFADRAAGTIDYPIDGYVNASNHMFQVFANLNFTIGKKDE